MRDVSGKAGTQAFIQIPEFASSPPKGGLESRWIVEQLDVLASALDAQANTLDEWREHTIQLLVQPLVDEDEGLEITGDEYEQSTKNQDEMFCYMQALRAVIADRHDALIGQENQLVLHEVKTALRLAREDQGPFPLKTITLLAIREELKPTKEMGSIRGIITELRALVTSLRPKAENGSSRAKAELLIVEKELSKIQKQLGEQTKATVALEKEVDLFTTVMNARLEYYRQLQQVSDSVSPDAEPDKRPQVPMTLEIETYLASKIATFKAKQRYLEHLKEQATNPEEHRICVICRDPFEVGAITVCGHQFCRQCIWQWWRGKSSEPGRDSRVLT
jgi:E3 ubiquitin-protein ligase SHPRH